MKPLIPHQYIDRATGQVRTETLTADPVIHTIYSTLRENAGFAFGLLVSGHASALLGALSYDFPFRRPMPDPARFMTAYGIDLTEVDGDPAGLTSWRRVFERRIRYWDLRPMDPAPEVVAAPADSRMVPGSFCDRDTLFIKEKFFSFAELLSPDKPQWCEAFENGDFAVFRLTPDKYHYNHTPVAGKVLDIYEITGLYHSCNPGAVVKEVTPYSKNRRVVTILDTEVPGGSGIGLVAMVEVAAMMIGDLTQCYSADRYHGPAEVRPGMFLEKGCPKSLFRPGSSTTILMFQKGRVRFSRDLLDNLVRAGVSSRFSSGFAQPLVETDVRVRSAIARAVVTDQEDKGK